MCSIEKIGSLFYGSSDLRKCYNYTMFFQGLQEPCIWSCDYMNKGIITSIIYIINILSVILVHRLCIRPISLFFENVLSSPSWVFFHMRWSKPHTASVRDYAVGYSIELGAYMCKYMYVDFDQNSAHICKMCTKLPWTMVKIK